MFQRYQASITAKVTDRTALLIASVHDDIDPSDFRAVEDRIQVVPPQTLTPSPII
jgi:hypothetical protein